MMLLSLAHAILLSSGCFSFAAAIDSGAERRPKLPKADHITPHCTWWYTYENSRSYQDILHENKVTLDDFRRWNPTIGTAGEGLIVGRAYCVAATSEAGAPSAVNKSPTKHAKPIKKGSAPPTKHAKAVKKGSAPPFHAQVGLTSTCTTFHLVKGGDICHDIVQKYGMFTLADFYEWNPAVGSSCRRLYAGFLVCVGVPSTMPPPSVQGPMPVQAGIIETCGKYHKAEPGDGCWHIADMHGIELDDL
ncbi:LysM domain-containing protein [Ophiocordyceps sinensis CO18]|uniref:LysM domain-containing protein n=1 Tax=Ophiocordyceps sinensis (strain Co18 / CGMCC 3.14243) TaxID=911162 RepID=T5AJ49_OPHSC|nr:LysM domain-containing protein [Ophiocordyceps sinensis CO18]